MTAIVPYRRPEPDGTKIVSGAPVSAAEWSLYAHLANYVVGKGACLVPAVMPERTISAAATDTYRFRVKTRAAGLQRIWVLTLRSTTSVATTADVRAPAGSGTIVTRPVTASRRGMQHFIYTESVTSGFGTEQEISISVKANVGAVFVEQIACYEQDRAIIGATADEPGAITGVDVETVRVRQPILTSAGWGDTGGVANLSGDTRRVGIFHLVTNDGNPWTKSTTGYQALLQLGVPVLAHKDLINDTTGTVKWSAYAKVTAGTGNVRITTTGSAVSDVVAVTGTVFAWTAARSISIHCDDMISTDGRQTSGTPVWDLLQAEIQGPGGTDTLSVAAISVWAE